MRKVKFRAWQPKIKAMCIVGAFDCTRNPPYYFSALMGFTDGIPRMSATINRKDEPDFILMQFTGLKDKSGKEIYEGDILENINGIRDVVESDHWNCSCCDGVYGWGLKDDDYGNGLRGHKELEIIGNIYENPELMEAK